VRELSHPPGAAQCAWRALSAGPCPVPLLSIATDLGLYESDTIGIVLPSLLRRRNAALDAIERADAVVVRGLAR